MDKSTLWWIQAHLRLARKEDIPSLRDLELGFAKAKMRQYQAEVERDFGISIIRCCYCGRAECSH